MKRFWCVAFLFVLHTCFAADAEPKPLFTILYTAESHAALLPCDCPLQPLGGVARRATLIKRFRERGPVLLVDGGGWAAGGLYDEDSDGESARDALRTQLMRDAMRMMKYDAMFQETTDPVEVRIGSQAFKIESLSEHSHIAFDRNHKEIAIALSRIGEDGSETLARNSSADLVFNAARKNTQRIAWRVGSSTLVNFDYQTHNLVVIEGFPAKPESGLRYEFRARLEPLTKDIPDDPEIVNLLAPHLEALKKKGKKRIEIEYWMLPECPGCKLSRPELQSIAKDLAGRVNIVPHWMVEKRGTELSAMHGEEELNEARVQTLIAKYYPEKIWEWLAWRAEHRDAWTVGAEKLGLLSTRIEQALNAKEADALLLADVELSERRRVHATPSLVIGNRLYESEIDRPHLLGALCGALEEPKPDCCKDAPACFFDAQCRKRGFVATCVDAGTPKAHCDTSKPAVKIPTTVLIDRDALASKQDEILGALLSDLPGLDYVLLDFSTPEGKSLAEQANVTRLPAFLLDPIAKTETGYKSSVGRFAKEISFRDEKNAERSLLLLREDQRGIGANRVLARPRIKGRADLFVSRFSKNGQEALETALDCAASREAQGLTLELHDVVYLQETAKGAKPQFAAKFGVAEVEEAARGIAVRLAAPTKLNAYLIERGKVRGSSYWDVPLKKLGLDPQAIRTLAEEPSTEVWKRLFDDAMLLKNLEAGGEIVLLAENCELITVASRNDLRQILERIASRK